MRVGGTGWGAGFLQLLSCMTPFLSGVFIHDVVLKCVPPGSVQLFTLDFISLVNKKKLFFFFSQS